jgi:DNA-binding NarL/FixJ family response regulator
VAQGYSSKEVGKQLFLSSSTVNHHIQVTFNKLGVDMCAQAVAVATQRQLLWPAAHLALVAQHT